MKKLIVITILSSLIIVGCGKKPQPSPEEVIPEIPEPIATVEVVETPQEDLSDVVIEVNDGNAEVVEVDPGGNGEATENGKPADEPSEVVEPETEEIVVETQVVVDPVQDLDEIVPDSTWTEYMIKPGQTLSLIAYEEFGNPNEWRTIYGWNKEKIGDDPNMIHPYHYLDLLVVFVLCV